MAVTARAALFTAERIVMAITWAQVGRYRRSAAGAWAFRKVSTLSQVFYENGKPLHGHSH
ncbi:hypothetical protein TRAPUB_10053 [Trametes pubescens]|uniref:Uncharacterized protein n=1 Tax=Trametes pubescens TaxID=154538 RepID=A0A1M2W0N0_TRAPU|nr:hypothetical protein TRAPUB_10053 [Trametes pubescens]